MRISTTLGALLLLGTVVAAPAQALIIDLDSDFGPIKLDLSESSPNVSGTYPKYDGRIVGKVSADSSTIDGFWIQPTSEQKCASQKEGSFYWGRLTFASPKGGAILGKWSYCDAVPSDAWNAMMK